MGITTSSLSQKDPVLFRVRSVGPNPNVARDPRMDVRVVVEILRSSKPRLHIMDLPSQWVAPYVDALNRVVTSQQIYWVDLDYSKTPGIPPLDVDDYVPIRFFRAVQDEQAVREPDPSPPPT